MLKYEPLAQLCFGQQLKGALPDFYTEGALKFSKLDFIFLYRFVALL